MKVPRGKCRINGVHITEITVQNMPGAQQKVEAVYALGEIDSRRGGQLIVGTHGRCTAYTNNWSEDTIKLLDKLLDAMEEDLLPRHFEVASEMEGEDEGIKSGEDEDADQI